MNGVNDPKRFIFLILSVFINIVLICFFMSKTLLFYDYPVLLIIIPMLFVIIYYIVFKAKNKTIIFLFAFLVIVSVLISTFDYNCIRTENVTDKMNFEHLNLKYLKSDLKGSAGTIKYYNKIMTKERFTYIEKEKTANDEEYLLDYNYYDFFFADNAESFYQRIFSDSSYDNNYIEQKNYKAFVIPLNNEIDYVKEFCLKYDTVVIHGFLWGDINEEELLIKMIENCSL
ncbi:MAG: hypothetical protein IJ446_01060 [Oscillospiraceae bacterium]|nr:hypothetical protein [Oscillospiraceae bacterium]